MYNYTIYNSKKQKLPKCRLTREDDINCSIYLLNIEHYRILYYSKNE